MKKYSISRCLKIIEEIIVPLLPGIICAGLCGSASQIIAQMIPDYMENDALRFIHQILSLINGSVMTFLTAWAGYRASERIGGTPILGGMLGMITSMEGINVISSVLGLYNNERPLDSILRSGKGGVLAVIVGAVFIALVEKAIRSVMPRSVDVIFTPLLTIFICVIPYVIFIMPLFGYVSEGIVWLFGRACLSQNIFIKAISGYLAAACFLPLVATGMHHGLIALYSLQLEELGYITLYPTLAMAGAGQVGAAIALWKKAKKAGNNDFCSVIAGALPAGIMGVGEPLIYGVTLPLGLPFLTAGLGAGFGGAFIMLTQVSSTGWGASGLLAAFMMTGGKNGGFRSVVLYLIALVISYIGGFVMTNIFYSEKEMNFETSLSDEQVAFRRSSSFARLSRKKSRIVHAGEPLMETVGYGKTIISIAASADGKTVPMKDIPSIMFSSGVIGKCVGIMPENGRVFAPCDGVVSDIADTNHEMTFRLDDGMEIILLAGIDTFSLNGDGISPLVKVGDKVTAGQEVMNLDLDKINNAGLSPIIITVMGIT